MEQNQNKNSQSVYQALQDLLKDETKNNIFGQFGLFGYRKESHKVLELFAEYSSREAYKNSGAIPSAFDSQSFIAHLNTLTGISDDEKQKIAEKIQSLRQDGQIKDYPPQENTFRNFAQLLYQLNIGLEPEKITSKYELALEKALGLRPLTEGTRISDKNKTGEAEIAKSPEGQQPKEAEFSATGHEHGHGQESSEKTELKADEEEKAELEMEEKSEETARVEVKAKSKTSTGNDETGKNEPTKNPEIEEKLESEKQEKPENVSKKPQAEIKKPKTETKKNQTEAEAENEKSQELFEKGTSHLIIRTKTPIYQRLNIPGKSTRRISQIQSRLGNLRKAEKVDGKRTQTQSESRQSVNPQQNQPDQLRHSQNPLREISGIPPQPKRKKKSLAKSLAKLSGASIGASIAAALSAGSSSADASIFLHLHWEKILKLLF